MPVVELLCKYCNAKMQEVDDSREVVFCSNCGTKHVIKDEIVNNTTINNTTQNITKQFYGTHATDYKDADELIADGEMFLEMNKTDNAREKFKKAIDLSPKNAKAWLGYAQTLNKYPDDMYEAFETAYKLITKEDKERLLFACMKTDRLEAMYQFLDETDKELMLDKWVERVEIANEGYSRLINFLFLMADIENIEAFEGTLEGTYLSKTLQPRWANLVKRRIKDGEREDYEEDLITFVVHELNFEEKEVVLRVLSRKDGERLKDFCVFDQDASDIVIKNKLLSNADIKEIKERRKFLEKEDKKERKKQQKRRFW